MKVIKMDMYQKRGMRKNKKMNEDIKSLPPTSIYRLMEKFYMKQ